MTTIQELHGQIRFQLEQLKSLNQHHAFEDLARQFSRQRICRNILPATGPVGAGGDQGRDFETYRTFLDGGYQITGTNLFQGSTSDGNVFFACSLKQKIVQKIKRDIKKIFSHTSEKRPIVYFCVENVPVGRRHELQKWCHDNYGVNLEVFDGNALAENLADPEIFWIATEFLHVPSDAFPYRNDDDDWYARDREKWIVEKIPPYNFADFVDIKYCLRKATFEKDQKPDLSAWIAVMEKFFDLESPDLRRRAQYEVCVAALRGQNNLDKYKSVVREYFSDIENFSNYTDLMDRTVLLNYCSSAKRYGEFDIETSYLHTLSKKLVNIYEEQLDKVSFTGARCQLLEMRAYAETLAFLDSETPNLRIDGAFSWWKELVDTVDSAPLYPLEHFADFLSVMTPVIGTDPRFLELTTKVDEKLSHRVGGFAAAEKCRDRAMAFYKNGHIIFAIDHLHRAKINWFSAETLKGTIITSRFIARCYEELGLMYAAKYYVLTAAYLAFHSPDDNVKDQISSAIFQAAEISYSAGEWLTFFTVMETALMVHQHYDPSPLDIVKHEKLQRVCIYTAIIRSLMGRFGAELVDPVEKRYQRWALDPETRSALSDLSDKQSPDSYWVMTPMEEIWARISDQLRGRPFSDVGAKREIEWRCLGILWKVSFPNEFEMTTLAEEFVAVLQVILTDLAGYDLPLIPTTVIIEIEISDEEKFEIKEESTNEFVKWRLAVPAFKKGANEDIDERTGQIFAIAVSALANCSTMTFEAFSEKLEMALERGLASKTFFVQPYPEIYRQIIPGDQFEAEERQNLHPAEGAREINFVEHDEVGWLDIPSSSYDEKLAKKHAINRYNKLIPIFSVLWPKIRDSEKASKVYKSFHEKGYRDWHIILIFCNAVANFIANAITWRRVSSNEYHAKMKDVVMKVINGEMADELQRFDIDSIDEDEFKISEELSYLSMMKTWDLNCNMQTPDFGAIKKFMNERYMVLDTDVPHDEVFPV